MALAIVAGQTDTPPPRPPLAGTLPPAARSSSASDDRPRGPLFISPMGEPFRGPDPISMWFDRADANRDGWITEDEFVADAARFFGVLDRGRDGEIDPDDIEHYETVVAPEIRTGGASIGGGNARAGGGRRDGGGRRRGGGMGGFGGGQGDGRSSSTAPTARYDDTRRGAARFSFFDFPEPVTVADANFNRGIDLREFIAAARDRFAMLDKDREGRLSRRALPKLPAANDGPGKRWPGPRPPGGNGGTPLTLTEADAGRTVTVTPGSDVTVRLTENPSTGYGWTAVAAPGIEQVGTQAYIADPMPKDAGEVMVGSGGTAVFRFRVARRGTHVLTLNYARSWESGRAPARTVRFVLAAR
ncbi:protease inhibitor I42 family protein [uncultured Sphingomonas sp.]|uniref:protease inhibitor I42 family protein n=1 Tax=uncultured Sphingomonas sp. TaxID=158754 RepID=UPI0035CAE1BF